MAAKVIVDKFLAQAKDMGVPQWLAKQGMELSNLIESGFLQPQSIANKGQISSAKRMYTEALGNKSFRNAQAAKLKSSGTVKTVQPVERPIITPESLQGSILTPVSGDTTSVGQSIEEMFGYSVDGVKVDGGPMFGLAMKDTVIDTSNPSLRAGWASMEDAAKTKQGGIDFIAEKTGNPRVIGSYGPMTDIAMNFAAPLSQTTAKITQQIKGIPKSIIKQFDTAIREGSGKKVSKTGDVTYNRKPYPDWVGIESKDAIDQLTGIGDFPKEGAGALRKAYMAVSAAKGDSKRGYMNFRDYGIPNRGTIVNEITEPSLIGVPKGSAGFSLFDAIPNQKTVPFGDNKFNDSYDTLIAGNAKGGHEINYPPEVYYPDMMGYLSKQVNKAGKPFTRDEQLGSFMMNPNIYQRADQKWLDGVKSFENKVLETVKQGGKPALAAAGLLGAFNSQAGNAPLNKLYSPESMSLLSSIPSQADVDGSTIQATPQSYSSQAANAIAGQMYGNQASRNRRAQSFGGILDFSPIGGADSMREGKRLREEGNIIEGLLSSILGAAEFVPVAGQAINKFGRAGLGLLR